MNVYVDMSWVMYKGLFAFPNFGVKNDLGIRPTGHIYHLLKVATSLTSKGFRVFLVKDNTPIRKLSSLSVDYKAGRPKNVYNVHRDVPEISSLVDYHPGIEVVEAVDIEADDVIASLVLDRGGIVYSGDDDFVQLHKYENVEIARTHSKGVPRVLDRYYSIVKFGVTPSQLPVYRTLVGDKSDNLKGLYRFPKDMAKGIAEDVEGFRDISLEFGKLFKKYGVTEARRRHLSLLRRNYAHLLDLYENFHYFSPKRLPKLDDIVRVECSSTPLEVAERMRIGDKLRKELKI